MLPSYNKHTNHKPSRRYWFLPRESHKKCLFLGTDGWADGWMDGHILAILMITLTTTSHKYQINDYSTYACPTHLGIFTSKKWLPSVYPRAHRHITDGQLAQTLAQTVFLYLYPSQLSTSCAFAGKPCNLLIYIQIQNIYIYALRHSVSLDHYVSGDQERKERLNIGREKLCTV